MRRVASNTNTLRRHRDYAVSTRAPETLLLAAKTIDKTFAAVKSGELSITTEGSALMSEIVNRVTDVFISDYELASYEQRLYFNKYLKRFLAADCVHLLSPENKERATALLAAQRTSST